ncbi:MAG TPA: XTP/dITP diphosphatase [Waddliaceae bacterium]
MEIVLATHNLHKVREFREMLKTLKNVDVVSLLNFPDYHLPEETGKTFCENAVLKAEHAAKALNRWVLADDSGLVVPALQERPGVYSQRYAGEDASDAENKKKLLDEMQHLVEIERSAYFECCLALASPEGLKKTVTGKCEGYIASKERGRNGFGYDPLFIKNDYKETFAELDEHTKNRISHRRKALDKLLAILEAL